MYAPSEKKILIIEDEPDVRNYLSACLEDSGFRVKSAINGMEGLEAVRESPPDLITLDMVMPRKSGLRFMRELRQYEEWASIPVIVITAHARDEWGNEEIKELNAFATRMRPKYVLEKPIKPSGLVRAIADILEVDLSGKQSAPSGNIEDLVTTLARDADQETLDRIQDMLSNKD